MDGSPPDYQTAMQARKVRISKISIAGVVSGSKATINRNYAILATDNPEGKSVWVEWRSYRSNHDEHLNKEVPIPSHSQRIQELVGLLQQDKPKEFYMPQCLGYFDDQDGICPPDNKVHEFRFGLIFEKPQDAEMVSLAQLLQDLPGIPLSNRIDIARKIVQCVLYLHAVNWLHKSLRSDNVLFFLRNGTVDLEQLHVSGFDCARLDTEEAKISGTTTEDESLLRWELYRHPQCQGTNRKGNYRKAFDLYSLGITLLELAHWKPIEQIVGIEEPESATFEALRNVRENFLKDAKYFQHVKNHLGNRYFKAVDSCLTGRHALGIADEEVEHAPETGAKLQQAFLTHVVSALGAINV
ncbi:MAG: hypothetical protein MMC33_002232 [Icmadophila ericetorum]|nr:hypothetical protein [Icmadophila ericetorum]